MRLLKSKTIQSTEYSLKHIGVLLLLGKGNSKVRVFNVLMLKTVLKWDC